jgi:hypothetical protein
MYCLFRKALILGHKHELMKDDDQTVNENLNPCINLFCSIKLF